MATATGGTRDGASAPNPDERSDKEAIHLSSLALQRASRTAALNAVATCSLLTAQVKVEAKKAKNAAAEKLWMQVERSYTMSRRNN